MEQFLHSQKQTAFINDVDVVLFRQTEKVLNQNFMNAQQFMKFQLDQMHNDVSKESNTELEQELESIDDEMERRLNQVMNDLDNNLVKIEEFQQIKDKKELIKLEIQENERDLKRKKDELVDKLKFVECSLGLIHNEQRLERHQQNYHGVTNSNAKHYRDRHQYYEEIKKQQQEAQKYIEKYNKQSNEVLKKIDYKYKQELEKNEQAQRQNRDREIEQLEEKKKQRQIRSEQNLHYIKQRQQMREKDINDQNKAYNQIKNQYNEVRNIKEEQKMEELKKMNQIKVYQQKIERIKNNYKNHIQDDYLKFDSEYQQRLKQKEIERVQKLQNNQNQWQCPQVY